MGVDFIRGRGRDERGSPPNGYAERLVISLRVSQYSLARLGNPDGAKLYTPWGYFYYVCLCVYLYYTRETLILLALR